MDPPKILGLLPEEIPDARAKRVSFIQDGARLRAISEAVFREYEQLRSEMEARSRWRLLPGLANIEFVEDFYFSCARSGSLAAEVKPRLQV